MNGRMSRLRRSLSRSLVQLNNVTIRRMRSLSRSVHQLNAVIPLGRQQVSAELPDVPYALNQSVLVGRFASPQTFTQLSEMVTKNNDSLREIISIFEEKVAMDFTYAKSLHKLATRLQKVATDSPCEVDRGWSSVADQFTAHATLHSNLGSALNDDLVQPLRSIHSTQQRTVRTAVSTAERETRKWRDKRNELEKSKRSLYVVSKELEKIEQLIDADSNMANKFSLRRKKLRDTVHKGEDDYLFSAIDLEAQRRTTYTVLRKAVENVEAVERQRLAHAQTALGRVQRKMEQLAPNLQQLFERYANELDVAVGCDAAAHIASLQPTSPAQHTVTLVDYFAENFSEIILGERRKGTLQRVSSLLDHQLRALYGKGPPSTGPGELSNVEFIEFLYFKINEALNSAEGGACRGYHRLASYLQKSKDRQGLANSLLIIPLGDPILYTDPTPGCYQDRNDDYDKISDEGFYNLSDPQNTETTSSLGTGPNFIEGSSRNSTGSAPSTTYDAKSSSNPGSETYKTLEAAKALDFNSETTLMPRNGYGIKVEKNGPTLSRQSTVIDDPDPDLPICKALYDFNGTHKEELTIKAGENLIVESRLGEDWLVGRTMDGVDRRGRFPTIYVSFLKTTTAAAQ